MNVNSNRLNYILVFVCKIIAAGTGFLTSILIANSLSSLESGVYFWFTALMTIILPLSSFCLQIPVMKIFASNARVGINLIYVICIGLFLWGVGLACIVFILGEELIDNFDYEWYLFGAIPAFAMLNVVSSSIQGRSYHLYSLIFQSLLPAFFLIAFIFFSPANVEYYLLSYLSSIILSLLIFLPSLRAKISAGETLCFLEIQKIFKSGASLLFPSIIIVLSSNIGILLLGLYEKLHDVTVLSLIIKITLVITFILQAFSRVVSPNLAKIIGTASYSEVVSTYVNCIKDILKVSLPIYFFMLFFSDDIMMLFGDKLEGEYLPYFSVLTIQMINCLTGPVGHIIILNEDESLYRKYNIISFVLASPSLFFVYYWGVWSAILFMAILIVSNNFLFLKYFYREFYVKQK
ncbi:lipopolysaccharide biosynthesis protein [Vibrio splendidus]